jgi:large subunit ribosomal protein L21
MYAIVEIAGKQYWVEKGDVIDVDLLNSSEDKQVEFKQVLFFNNDSAVKVGSPYLPKSVVKGELIGQVSGPKVISFKYKQRKGVRRKVGHRQKYSRIKITEIVG